MLTKSAVFSLLLVVSLTGCEQPSEAPPAPPTAPANGPASPATKVGAPLPAGERLSVAELVAKAPEFKDKTVLVSGTVRQACTRKGCWMELAGGSDKSQPGCRVTFKDYAFFVPVDSAGSTASVQGLVSVETVSAAQVQHMESEGGQFPIKNPDGTANEVRIIATGVELTRPGS